MTLIQPKDIANKLHRNLIEKYGSSLASTPLRTAFHRSPNLDEETDALRKKYDFTEYMYPELVYRYYFDSNFTALIYGPRSEYKSTCALLLKTWCEKIAGIAFNPELPGVVDRDKEVLNFYQQDVSKFFTIIKDEWDKQRSGIGIGTMSETMNNIINRIRGRFINLIICTPQFTPYTVDYYFRTWEYIRYGERIVQLLVYDEDENLKGHVTLPMPTNFEIECYAKRKKIFLDRTKNLGFTIDEILVGYAEEIIQDPDFPPLVQNEKSGNFSNPYKDARITYIGLVFDDLISESLKKRVENLAKTMQILGVSKFPRPTKK